MATSVDAVVIGAGVVGLAVGQALAAAGLKPLLLEAEYRYGNCTSARNSEVIHTGLHYPKDWLKTRLCIEGRERLYRYCEAMAVPYKKTGKLIVAYEACDLRVLDELASLAVRAGIEEFESLSSGAVKTCEPEMLCRAALRFPETGIVDSQALMSALLTQIEAGGGQLVVRTSVEALELHGDEWLVYVAGEDDAAVRTSLVVNAAGLAAHKVAASIDALDPIYVPNISYARGVYFSYSGKLPFRHLIYPVPVAGGLGTHLTFDLAGAARFGPDVEWLDDVDYTIPPWKFDVFLAAARRIWPDIDASRLQPSYAGIRPKLAGRNESPVDFRIDGPELHRLPGLVNLFGIESPGLTSCLAIGNQVRALLT